MEIVTPTACLSADSDYIDGLKHHFMFNMEKQEYQVPEVVVAPVETDAFLATSAPDFTGGDDFGFFI